MKYFFTAVWGIICVGVLFYGHSYWNERTAVKADTAKQIKYSAIQKQQRRMSPMYDEILAKAQKLAGSCPPAVRAISKAKQTF